MPSSNDAADNAQIAQSIKVIAFDIFGTVVDWHGSIAKEIDALNWPVSGNEFALAWREGYRPAMEKVMRGELGWTKIDDLHRMILDDLLQRFHITHLNEEEKRHLNKVWHRLHPWPDAVAGLSRLKTRYTICTLSNGNIGLLANMAKFGGLPWYCILSAEVFRKYKPDPATYLGVAETFEVSPSEVMLAAAHQSDLTGARACGLRTTYLERPLEYGVSVFKDVSADPANTYHAKDINDLANQLGC